MKKNNRARAAKRALDMNRINRPGWFAAGAGAIGLAAMLAVDIPANEPSAAREAFAGAIESADDAPPVRPENYEASLSAGREIVERAIEAGRWTHRDVAAFSAATAALELPDQLALHQRLVAAINEDRVQVQGPDWQQ